MGVPTAAIKLQAFVLSAALAAVAGSLLTHYNGSIGPSEAGPLKSVRYVALVAAGGMANVWGGMTVSALINYLSLRGYFGTLDHAVFGLLLVAIISLAPEGPLPALGAWLRRAARAARPPRRSADAAA
jgi:branched-chain amino acid transport system permease protein